MGYTRIPSDYDYDYGLIRVHRGQILGMFLWSTIFSVMIMKFWTSDVIGSLFSGLIIGGLGTLSYDVFFSQREVRRIQREQNYILNEIHKEQEERDEEVEPLRQGVEDMALSDDESSDSEGVATRTSSDEESDSEGTSRRPQASHSWRRMRCGRLSSYY